MSHDEPRDLPNPDPTDNTLSRREFVALSVAAGLAAGAGVTAQETAAVQEHELRITTPDGTCDAALLHPATGRHAGVLMWPDAFGLRPVKREMARRLAAAGFAVLVPNPYYRNGPAPLPAEPIDFRNAEHRARLQELMGPLSAAGAAERDAQAYCAFLDAQAAVDTGRKLGVHGYCMGGPLSFRSAAAVPGRIGALASFHGGGLVTAAEDSPHLLVPKLHARTYVAIAADDDAKEPEAKTALRAAFAAAGMSAEIEVYANTLHGWCVRDMRPRDGAPIYNEPEAERAWAKLLELYRTALV